MPEPVRVDPNDIDVAREAIAQIIKDLWDCSTNMDRGLRWDMAVASVAKLRLLGWHGPNDSRIAIARRGLEVLGACPAKAVQIVAQVTLKDMDEA